MVIFNCKYGERGSGFRPKGEVQDFAKIRDRCLQSGTLFEDPEFPAEDSSIYFSRRCPGSMEWLRPSFVQTRGMPNPPSQMIPDMLDWRQIWGSGRPRKGSNSVDTVL
ncbi:calpain-A [Trichonephila clavipes]|nr:calpain-A [Trichonephila clavipes]